MALLLGLLVLGASACQLIEQRTGRPVTKILLVGDSVIWYAQPYLQAQFAGYGVTVESVAVPGTGPLFTVDGQKAWATLLSQKLETFDADVVIFQSCCHYPGGPAGSPLYVNDDGVTVQPGTQLMYDELAAANAELVQIARDAGASPYWIELPPGTEGSLIYGSDILGRIDGFNALLAGLDATVLDWGGAVLAEPDAEALRHPDGIHYSTAGNTFLARYTFAQIVQVAA